MITAIRSDERDRGVDIEQPPLSYPEECSYARQMLVYAIVAMVQATITVMVGLSVAGVST
jgi:hypothetical protein